MSGAYGSLISRRRFRTDSSELTRLETTFDLSQGRRETKGLPIARTGPQLSAIALVSRGRSLVFGSAFDVSTARRSAFCQPRTGWSGRAFDPASLCRLTTRITGSAYRG